MTLRHKSPPRNLSQSIWGIALRTIKTQLAYLVALSLRLFFSCGKPDTEPML